MQVLSRPACAYEETLLLDALPTYSRDNPPAGFTVEGDGTTLNTRLKRFRLVDMEYRHLILRNEETGNVYFATTASIVGEDGSRTFDAVESLYSAKRRGIAPCASDLACGTCQRSGKTPTP